MKHLKGYLYNHKGKVVVNPRLMPKREDYVIHRKGFPLTGRITHEHNKALAEWESNLIEVENVELRTIGSNKYWKIDEKGQIPIMSIYQQAQPCLYTVNEKATITKII